MKRHLVIFDLDNTLVVTSPAAKHGYKQAINHIAKMEGRYKDNKKLYNHWKKIVQRVMGEKKPQMRRFEYSLKILLEEQSLTDKYFSSAMHIYEKELLNMLEPQKGARDLLAWLRELDQHIVISTASGKSESKKKLKKTQLSPLIDFVVSADDIGSMKPHPDFIKIPLERFKVGNDLTVVIGDNQKEDLEPAKSLGIKTILIPNGKFHLGTVKQELETWFNETEAL